jgi:hypothetical protein
MLIYANLYKVFFFFFLGSELCCVWGGWIFINSAGSVEHDLNKNQVLNGR